MVVHGGAGQMRALELLRLANNRLSAPLPPWLFEGRQLPRLSWLALAGNPAVDSAPPRAEELRSVRPAELALGKVLGGGTSGDVLLATWRGQEVAVKRYAAAVSSDGRSLDEVLAATHVQVGGGSCGSSTAFACSRFETKLSAVSQSRSRDHYPSWWMMMMI
jgi:hypothetical protein